MKKPLLVKTKLDDQIAQLASKTDKRTLVVWACDCVERVLPYFEKNYPKDKHPKLAIKAARKWVKDGIFKMSEVRRMSLESHKSAREIRENHPARSVARAAGQALATTHAPTHSIAAAIYATTAIKDGAKSNDFETAVIKEREWQYQHLLELKKSKEINFAK